MKVQLVEWQLLFDHCARGLSRLKKTLVILLPVAAGIVAVILLGNRSAVPAVRS